MAWKGEKEKEKEEGGEAWSTRGREEVTEEKKVKQAEDKEKEEDEKEYEKKKKEKVIFMCSNHVKFLLLPILPDRFLVSFATINRRISLGKQVVSST